MKQVKSTVWILLCSCSIISLYVYSNASWAVKSRTGDCTYPEQQQPDAGVLRQQTEKVDHTADRSSALRVGSNNIPTIDQLARVDEQEYSCPAGTIPVFSKPASNTTSTQRPGYKIPFAIHQTCKSRCVSEEVYGYMQQWSNLGIPYYLHDDEAMEALVLSEAAKDFPQLQVIWTQCLRVPAARADLWRMLLLWTYGGICTYKYVRILTGLYASTITFWLTNWPVPIQRLHTLTIADADIDTRPNKFRPLTHIHPDDEVYALSDNEGLPSFHFFAAMPRHPLVYLVIQRGLNNVMLVSDVAAYNPARFTGTVLVGIVCAYYFLLLMN